MLKVITSWRNRPSRWLPLTWSMGTVSALIWQTGLAHEIIQEIMRKAAQSIQSIQHGGGGDHLDCCCGATSPPAEGHSVVDSSPKIYLPVRRRRAATARSVGGAVGDVRERQVFLRFPVAASEVTT